ncbi:dirigent protein 22-like [Magnolia sinica]|uniref:dirigent protein 22-like n=1 Tax=Magnolia sinica TaxID=86752 RepID=UPI0026592C13|nr:dirigent protein 22-like [Magnolia sinica]
MARFLFNLHLFIIIFLFFVLVVSAKTHRSPQMPRPAVGFGKEKISHLNFYFHDILSGPKPTAVPVAAAASTKKSPTFFGAVVMTDDPLTETPDPKSKLFGRAQGFYAFASQEDLSLLMAMTFAFVDGEYNGSSLGILGRNTVLSKVREMPVVGGSGLFRFARGYAQAHTHAFNVTSGDAVVEYNVRVIHY